MLILEDAEALARTGADAIRSLTEAATSATFYRDGMTPEQLAANRRVIDISAPSCIAAAASPHQLFAAAFAEDAFAGYVIATRHAEQDLELDWLMVDPRFHGSPVSSALMARGVEWLGRERAMWLTVIAYNERAIRFYRRFGFEVDPDAVLERAVPTAIMRKPGD